MELKEQMEKKKKKSDSIEMPVRPKILDNYIIFDLKKYFFVITKPGFFEYNCNIRYNEIV
jgi:hypothetical protein